MLESEYKTKLIKRLRRLFPGSIILRNDPGFLQGIPDLIILYGDRWAALEVKISIEAPFQPNQEYYLGLMDEMSYAACIFPENEEDILHELYAALTVGGPARIPQRQQLPLDKLRRGKA
jgi:hypothetical protein